MIEDRFRIFFNDYPITDMVASRDQLKESGAGFAITEGITRCVDKVSDLMETASLYRAYNAQDYCLRLKIMDVGLTAGTGQCVR